MAKNHDLIWAREFAGWSQEEAASRMEVSRQTYCGWENNKPSPIPPRKFKVFLKLVGISESDIPSDEAAASHTPASVARAYDKDGYPVGYQRQPCTKEGYALDVASLRKLEGAEFVARERVRYEERLKRFPGMDAAYREKLLERYDRIQSYQWVKDVPPRPERLNYGENGYPLELDRRKYFPPTEQEKILRAWEGEEFEMRDKVRVEWAAAWLEKRGMRMPEPDGSDLV